MTPIEAYVLAKKIAISAVSGVRNLSVDGTKLIIETNDGNTLEMDFPIPDGVKTGYYDKDNDKFYINDDFTGEIQGKDKLLYIDKGEGKLYHWNSEGDPKKFQLLAGSGGGGGSAELISALTATQTVGGVAAGKQYAVDTPLETILRDILAPVLYPNFTAPSASISVSGNKVLETGSTVSKTFTVSFNRGSISPAYGTSSYRAGAATGYILNGGDEQSTNSFTETVSESNKTFQATVKYAAGEQPKDSSGANYNSPLAAGSVNTSTVTYEFVDRIWANTDDNDITEVVKQPITSKTTKVYRFDFPATSEDYPEVFDMPASWTITGIEVLNSLSNQWEEADEQFSLTNITHKNAGNTDVNYVRYTCNLGMDLGDRSVRVKWN